MNCMAEEPSAGCPADKGSELSVYSSVRRTAGASPFSLGFQSVAALIIAKGLNYEFAIAFSRRI